MSQRISLGRRRSRSLCGWQTKNFCETIPRDLPESERLLKLIELSYKHALKETIKHAKVKEDFDSGDFLKKGEECLENVKANIMEKNLHISAVESEGQEECHGESQWHADIKVFEEESEKWSSLVTTCRENLQKEMNTTYSIDASTVERNNDYNYDDILKETAVLEKGLSKKISSLSAANFNINTGLKLSKLYESKLERDCERYYHEEISNSPRTMLRRLGPPRR